MSVTVNSPWSFRYGQVVTRDQNISYGGGVRARFIYDSIWDIINNGLRALGWYNPTIYNSDGSLNPSAPSNARKHHPVNFVPEQLNWDQEIQINTLAFVPENVTDKEWELGSLMTEDRWIYYLDFFAENEAISIQLTGDIRDILRGKLSSIGRGYGPLVDICDLAQPGHYKIGYVQIENVTVDRVPTYTQRWQRYMRTVRFEACDYYALDSDSISVGRANWAFQP